MTISEKYATLSDLGYGEFNSRGFAGDNTSDGAGSNEGCGSKQGSGGGAGSQASLLSNHHTANSKGIGSGKE